MKKFRIIIILPFMKIIASLWLFASLQSRNLLMSNITVGGGVIFIIAIVIICFYRRYLLRMVVRLIDFLYQHKYQTIISLFVCQLVFIFAIQTIPGWDIGQLILGARLDMNISYYLNVYPLNKPLYMFIRALVIAFGDVWFLPALLIFNAIAINISILGCVEIAKNLKMKVNGAYVFAFGVFFMGIIPWVLIPYTDTLVLPFVVLGMLSIAKLQHNEKYTLWSIILGISIAFAFQVKASSVIFLIAALILKIIGIYNKRDVINLKSLKNIALVSAAIISITFLINVSKNLTSIELDSDNAMPITHIIMMGLQGNGGYSFEDFQLTRSVSGREARIELNIREIQSRLSEHGVLGYTSFLLRKFYFTFEDGTFGWGNEGYFLESTNVQFPDMPSLVSGFSESRIGRVVQYFIFADSEGMAHLRIISGMFYVFLVAGIWLSTFTNSLKDEVDDINWLQLSILGTVLFFMIFEAGRSRYLIQFFPQIVLLSAIGWSRIEEKRVSFPTNANFKSTA